MNIKIGDIIEFEKPIAFKEPVVMKSAVVAIVGNKILLESGDTFYSFPK